MIRSSMFIHDPLQWVGRAMPALVLCVAPAMAQAQTAISAITGTKINGQEVIKVDFSQPLTALPEGFAVQTPPRIAIDLPGVVSQLGSSNVAINQGNVRNALVAQTPDRTRLVLALQQAADYEAKISGNSLLIALTAPAAQAAEPFAVAAVAEPVAPTRTTPAAVERTGIRSIDFRKSVDGSGRIIVEMNNKSARPDIRQEGQNLVVEFDQTSLPDALRRRMDVSDFGAPVNSITATQAGSKVRLLVQSRGNWQESASQIDNTFVLEVKNIAAADRSKPEVAKAFTGQKISLNFQNIEVRALLQVIADFTNFNVVTSDTVTGNVTLRLKDVPWDQALDIIMQARDLGMKKSGNVLMIAPKAELAKREQADLESRKLVQELEPVRTQSIQLNYARAEEVAKALKGGENTQTTTDATGNKTSTVTRILSNRGSIIPEVRTNQLFVSDIPSKLEEIQKWIAKIDVPVRQVMIEARIVEADQSFGRALGVRLGGTDMRGMRGGVPGYSLGAGNSVAIGGNYSAVGTQTLQTTTDAAANFSNSNFVNLPANTGSLGSAAASVAFTLFSAAANRFLNLELSALESENKGKVISSPRIVTSDQIKSSIEQGIEIPYTTVSQNGTNTEFKKASLLLDVTPRITPDGNVTLNVEVNKDSIGATTATGVGINTKRLKTEVQIENGGTVVLGGVYMQEENDVVNKVPVLGDLPYVGALFRNKSKVVKNSELLIFLTPRIMSERTEVR